MIQEIERPKTSLEGEWFCSFFTEKLCLIQSSDLELNEYLYIGLECTTPSCNTVIHVETLDVQSLEEGASKETLIRENELAIFRMQLPPFKKSVSEDYQFIIKAIALTKHTHDFELSATEAIKGNFNKSLSSSFEQEYSYFKPQDGVSAWKKGRVIKISSNDFSGDCDNCDIYVVLKAKDSGYYQISAKMTDAIEVLKNQIELEDLVDTNEQQCYSYEVKNSNKDLQINFQIYSGSAEIYINPKTIPTNIQDSLIQREANQQTLIYIDKNQREELNQTTGIYYICVVGSLNVIAYTATYSIIVYEFQPEIDVLRLNDGYQQEMKIKPNGTIQFYYQVPEADYVGEDMEIDLRVVVRSSGARPILKANACNEVSIWTCFDETWLQMNQNSFQKGVEKGYFVTLSLDPDEKVCGLHGDNKDCAYIIIIENPSSNQSISFDIVAQHTQNNHIQLYERKSIIDHVKFKQMRYYKFVLLDTTDVQQIDFEISPLHGDCDAFYSQSNKFPTLFHFDEGSLSIGSQQEKLSIGIDQLINNQSDQTNTKKQSLQLYLGVYGYTYCSYQVTVKVKRQNDQQLIDIHDQAQKLFEGIPLHYTMKSENDTFIGYFDIDLPLNSDKSILVSVYNTHGRTITHVKYNQMPQQHTQSRLEDSNEYELIRDGVITIKPFQTGYHNSGTYYIMVVQDQSGVYNHSSTQFKIDWRLEDTIPYILEHQSQPLQIDPNSFHYSRHYVLQTDIDIQISLKVGYGTQDIYVSFKQDPTRDDFTLSTKTQQQQQFVTSQKSLSIRNKKLKESNSACNDQSDDLTEDLCIIYIGVYCNGISGCKSILDINYIDYKPKKLMIGQSKHGSIYPKGQIFYYLNIKKSSMDDDIYAVLQPLNNNLDLYVDYKLENKESKFDTSISTQDNLPGPDNFMQQSVETDRSEMIHITKQNLLECFEQSFDNQGTQIETYDDTICTITFGIYAREQYLIQPYNDDTELFYTFIAYKNVIEVQDNLAITGSVNQGQFKYFIYNFEDDNHTCKYEEKDQNQQECSLVIGVSSSNGDPDVYIVKGDRLATLNEYDMKQTTQHSEVIIIDRENPMTQSKLPGYYVIGIYGNKNSTFTLTVHKQSSLGGQAIITLKEGIKLRNSQIKNQITYFTFFNWVLFDLEFQFEVTKGEASLYITTFRQSDEEENIIDKLPNSNNTVWKLDNVQPLSIEEQQHQVVLKEDRHYCQECSFILAVQTFSQDTKYSILAKNFDSAYTEMNMIRIGEIKTVTLTKKDQEKILFFMISSHETTSIIPSIFSGEVNIYVSEDLLKENAISSTIINNQQNSTKSGKLTLKLKKSIIKPEINYYIIIESITDYAQLSIVLEQRQTLITLKDGQAQQVKFIDLFDKFKFFLYDLPEGDNISVQISLKSLRAEFYPIVYVSLNTGDAYKNISSHRDEIQTWLQQDDIKNQSSKLWDRDLYNYQNLLTFDHLNSDSALVIVLAYNLECGCQFEDPEKKDTAAESILTVQHSKIVRLQDGQEYFSYLQYSHDQQTYQINAVPNMITVVEISMCSGLLNYHVRNIQNGLFVDMDYIYEDGKMQLEKVLDGPHLIIISNYFTYQEGPINNQYIIKVSYHTEKSKQERKQYRSEDNNLIQYEFEETNDQSQHQNNKIVKLSWKPLWEYSQNGIEVLQDIKYVVVETDVQDARVDQFCAVKKLSNLYKDVVETNLTTYNIDISKDITKTLQINVFAIDDKKQIIQPYKQITLGPKSTSQFFNNDYFVLGVSIYLIIVIIAFFVILVLCIFYSKNKNLRQRLEDEVRDVQSASTNQTTSSQKSYNKVKKGQKVKKDKDEDEDDDEI